MTPGPIAPAPDEAIALEPEMQTKQCRADPQRVRELLDEDFLEMGASGRRRPCQSAPVLVRGGVILTMWKMEPLAPAVERVHRPSADA